MAWGDVGITVADQIQVERVSTGVQKKIEELRIVKIESNRS